MKISETKIHVCLEFIVITLFEFNLQNSLVYNTYKRDTLISIQIFLAKRLHSMLIHGWGIRNNGSSARARNYFGEQEQIPCRLFNF